MNKSELITAVSIKTEMTKKDAEKAVSAVFESITEALENKDKVRLTDFGTFEVKERAEKTGRNPSTKEQIIIPKHNSPTFKAAKKLKELVNGGLK